MNEIPDGYTSVEVIIDENGNFSSKVLGHGKNASCMENDDVLDKLMAGLGEVTDFGHTDEHYQEQKARKTKPMKYKEQENDESKPMKNKKLDMGFGV